MAALTDIPDHRLLIRLLIRPGGRIGSQGSTDGVMRHHGGLLAGPADGGGQPMLTPSSSGGDHRRSSTARSATTATVRSAKDRSASPSRSARGGAGQLATDGGDHVWSSSRLDVWPVTS